MESDNRPQTANTLGPLILCIRSGLLHFAVQKRILGADLGSRIAEGDALNTSSSAVHCVSRLETVLGIGDLSSVLSRVAATAYYGTKARRGADSRGLYSPKPVEC